METVKTPITEKLGIKYPILLAGMSGVSHAQLAAAVSNAGGLGVIGGLTLTPKVLRRELTELKSLLKDPSLPFGVDLAIPQVGGNARKTNHDYTHGNLDKLVDIMIEEGCRLFVCAVGVPPRHIVDRLHGAGIPIMNMVGAPKHVTKALDAGVDYICAQGTEGGGHTGEVGAMALIPQCIEKCKGRTSSLDGSPIYVVGAGGIVNGDGMAAALSLGAQAVWIGTRFVASVESHASNRHKQSICNVGPLETTRSLIYSGRPLRTLVTPYVAEWHSKLDKVNELCEQGVVPYNWDIKQHEKEGKDFSIATTFPQLMGQGVGLIHEVKPAEEIVNELITGCIASLRKNTARISKL